MKRPDLKAAQDVMEPNITECPYCGHDEYYVNYRYSGTGVYRYRFDGEDAENGDVYDCLKDTIVGKFAYCCNCKKEDFQNKRLSLQPQAIFLCNSPQTNIDKLCKITSFFSLSLSFLSSFSSSSVSE